MIARFFLEPIGRFDVSRANGECSLEMVSSPSDDENDDDDENSALKQILLFSELKTRQEGEKRRALGAHVKVVMILLIYGAYTLSLSASFNGKFEWKNRIKKRRFSHSGLLRRRYNNGLHRRRRRRRQRRRINND
jgi:hypothetical protein